MQTFTLGVTRSLASNVTLDVRYIGTRGVKIHSGFNINDADFRNKVQPEYPELAKQQGIQGTAVVMVTISASGALVSAKIYQSSGNPLLDNAALRAARASTFKPPSLQSDYLIDYVFQLD